MANKGSLSNVRALLTRYGTTVTNEAKNRLKGADKVATGKLLNSIAFSIITVGQKLVIRWVAEDYLEFVDKGRPEGKQPPLDKIKAWAAVKGIPESKAFGIAAAIGENGVAPTNFWTISSTRRQKQFNKQLETAYGKDLEVDIQIEAAAMTKKLKIKR
tara:strand:+ start:154 stop:627 length:474 start_codon:yes stop_codon:yes gene_type:complete